jgi:hypothetical protein
MKLALRMSRQATARSGNFLFEAIILVLDWHTKKTKNNIFRPTLELSIFGRQIRCVNVTPACSNITRATGLFYAMSRKITCRCLQRFNGQLFRDLPIKTRGGKESEFIVDL